MKKSTTVRSLIACGLSMLLCLSMLAGTTFAWFTDSVESGTNQIIAGNLDVELYNSIGAVDGKQIDTSTKLFNMALWEPGAMVYENLTVANEGTLALKYQLSVNFANATENAEGKTLAEVLKVAVVKGGIENKTREDLKTLDYTSLASFIKAGKLEAGANETYGIVIWWEPTENDNAFNMNNGKTGVMSIDIGVKLLATQATAEAEKDSFGPDYDADATVDGFEVVDADSLQTAINNGETAITLVDDIVLDAPITIPAPAATTYSLRSNAIVIDLNGKTITNENGYVIENKGNIVITGNGTLSGLGCIRSKAGSITIENGNFFASSQWQNGVYQHTLKAENTNVVINGGNFDATVNGQTNAMFNASENGVITINGGSFKNVAGDLTAFDPYIFTYEKNGAVVINDGTFYGGWRFNGETTTTEIYGGDFTLSYDGQSFHAASTHIVTVYGGSFTAGSKFATKVAADLVAEGYSAVLENDGTYTVLPGDNTEFVENGLYKDGNTYYVTNANGLLALTTKSDTYFSGKTIKLANDIDCTDVAMKKIHIWDPENPTTFDGCGYTIYNLDISTASGSSDQGLINGTVNVKNLTVDGAWVEGYGYVGVISGKLYGNIENCHVKNAQVFAGYWQAGIIVGQFNGTSIKDCSVVDSDIYSPSAVGAVAGIFTDNNATDIKFENCVVKGCDINQTYSFGSSYDILYGAILGCGNVSGKNYIFNGCVVEDTTIKGETSTTICGKGSTVWIDGVPMVYSADQLAAVVKAGATNILLADGEYDLHGCGGKTLTITGSKNAVIKVANEGESGSDYAFDGSTVTFNGVTFDTSANNGSYKGYARMVGIYNDCTFNGSYALNNDSEFTNCTFNISGDNYNIWTWGAPNATFTGCTFNSDGKAVLLYGGVNTALTLNDCTFNDNGGLSDKKAAVEIGNDYGASYTLIVNNTVVNGYEINDKGINTGSTLWGNKNSMGTDKLNVIVDGVDVY